MQVLSAKRLEQARDQAAAWLLRCYPDRSQIIPFFGDNCPTTLAMAMGALVSGHRLCFIPKDGEIPDWLGEHLPLAPKLVAKEVNLADI